MISTIEAIGGVLYLVLSTGAMHHYLVLLNPSMINDLWWADFNASGAHSYLVDLANMQLNTNANGTVDLFDLAMAIPKDYSQYITPIPVSPVYARQVLYTTRTDFETLIPAGRNCFRVVRSPPKGDASAAPFPW
ncbi:Aste57867_3953 [Aphanomyces stellatus]|uniref:Aste57867_3953 protein n=1 Tax=Aphanomyces stellatus TaxID=120398 RepID=A0A485KBQ2_9STRA|nr:hypothetical protein As57867_003942 [Aphanomyces stellatus]VFT81090.1 Aste57867_3953 [Aphanomyces stellatus]